MFKSALLVAATVFSFSAFAGGTISVNPTSPVVFTSNYQDGNVMIQGPWFQSQYTVTVNDFSEATGLLMEVTTIEGNSVTYEIPFDQPVMMNPGDSIQTPVFYVDNLPASSSLQYTVRVDVEGQSSSGGPLGIATAIVTQ